MSLFSKIKFKISLIIKKLTFSPIAYWEERAKIHGERSVLNLSHGDEELKAVKDFQVKTIFPLLQKELKGNERSLLDFGCGPGRFCVDLANLTGCEVTGADPIEYLLQLAPKDPRISYKKIEHGRIPAADESFDIIWVCLVLGGIVTRKDLKKTIKELNRVARKGSLLFLIENTTVKKNILSWQYHSKAFYINLFKNFNLFHLKDYEDLGECISMFAGRMVDK
ncbi:MAG: class I SAM-dependent methyltransferase [Mucilaginibacter sp.]